MKGLLLGLAVLALIQFWCKARRAEYTSPTGEIALLFSGFAYLVVLLTSALLPVWATLAFAAAPLLGGPLSIMPGSTTSQILSFLGLPPYPELGNLALAISWLMLGSALILLPPSRPRARVALP
jgi:hypothetical protein